MADFPENLKYFRKKNKLTQQQLADKTGLNQRTYSDYERGKTEPSIKILITLAKLFTISVDALVGFTFDIAQKKEDREILKEAGKKADVTDTEVLIDSVKQVAENVKAKATGRKPRRVYKENYIEAVREAKEKKSN